MDPSSVTYQRSEHAFANWYENAQAPTLSGMELRIVDLLGEIHACEKYIARRAKTWLVWDQYRRRKIGDKQMRLVQLRAEKARVERSLEAIIKKDTYARGREMFARICAIPRVVSVACGHKKLTVYTDRLYSYGASPTGFVWYRLGEYSLEIDLEKPKVDWVRWRTNETDRPSHLCAPQISSEGIVRCFGVDAQTWFDLALPINEFDTVVNVLVRFTECPATSEYMKGWPIVDASEVPAWYLGTPLSWRD